MVVRDDVVEPVSPALLPGSTFTQVWGADAPVQLPSDGGEPPWSSFVPPADGFRFLLWTVPPESEAAAIPAADVAAGFAELERALPGLLEFNEVDQPGMHTTDTVDLDVVVAGELWLELDDGAEVHLRPGDVVIQNGTRHAWHNRGTVPATIVTALVGAVRPS